MKKFLTMGMLALVALSATLFTSCGDDDYETPSGSNKFLVYIGSQVFTTQVNTTVINQLQLIVGSAGKVESTTDPKTIYISYSSSKKDLLVEKLESASLDAMDAALESLHQASLVRISIFSTDKVDDNLMILDHYYKMDYSKFLPGTYTSTLSNGSPIKLQISEPEGDIYSATVTIGTNPYYGTFQIIPDQSGLHYIEFKDDTNYVEIYVPGDLYTQFWHGIERFGANVTSGTGDDYQKSLNIEFTRQ